MQGGAQVAQTPAVALGVSVLPASVQASGTSTCAVLTDGTAKCWGSNLNGKIIMAHHICTVSLTYDGLTTPDHVMLAYRKAE